MNSFNEKLRYWLRPGLPTRIIRYVSRLIQCVWLFFPAIAFLLLAMACFWGAGQGKDIIAAFVKNSSSTFSFFNYSRVVFFLAIGFWVYISWYSSRIIAYIKKTKQVGLIKALADKIKPVPPLTKEAAASLYSNDKSDFEPGDALLDEIPRVIGNAAFLILELAVLQCPILKTPLNGSWAFGILIVALIILRFVNRAINNRMIQRMQQAGDTNLRIRKFWKAFKIIAIVFLILVVITSMIKNDFVDEVFIYVFFGLLILFHVVFIFYTNLKRTDVNNNPTKISQYNKGNFLIKHIMESLCIPAKEYGYFTWMLGVILVAIIIYTFVIFNINFAQIIGPFPVIILGFGTLLAFLNFISAYSVKYRINFHFLLFIAAMIGGQGETHRVRTNELNHANNYKEKPQLAKYLSAWLNEHVKDTTYDMYFVMANGGASRSGYWTASVLGKIQDASAKKDSNNLFSDHVFCLSGTSGGGVGVAAFFSLLQGRKRSDAQFETSAKDYLKRDYFTYTFARLLGPDYFSDVLNVLRVLPVHAADRAAALEESFEKCVPTYNTDGFRVPFNKNFSSFAAMNNAQNVPLLPILCINSTRMQDGNPGIVSNLRIDSATFNNRIDILTLLDSTSDISMASGSILGARFPYLSPAGKIGDSYFVDGGYFDNSGAGVVQEMIRGIIKIANDSPALRAKINLLHFKVIHIVNSPVINDNSKFQPVASVKNDLLAPVLTIMGAYDMQTTVNDQRLINYIADVADTGKRASYTRISLYEDGLEWKNDTELNQRFDKEPSYAMNWFISDTTVNRINKRLSDGHNRILDSLLKTFR